MEGKYKKKGDNNQNTWNKKEEVEIVVVKENLIVSLFILSFICSCLYLAVSWVPRPALAVNRRIMDTSIAKAKLYMRRAVAERDTSTFQKRRKTAKRVHCCTQNILKKRKNRNL